MTTRALILLLAFSWLIFIDPITSEHICHALLSGTPFALLHIKSLTYANERTLAIFVGDYTVYLVSTSNVTTSEIPLSTIESGGLTPFASSLKLLPQGLSELKALYCAEARYYWLWSWYKRVMLHVIKNGGATYTVDALKKSLMTNGKHDKEYTIAHKWTANNGVFGYMFTQVASMITISQLDWSFDGKVTPVDGSRSYYLQLTGNSSEVVFVHRKGLKKPPDNSQQLLVSLPRGILHDSELYILDEHRGCVYVIRPWIPDTEQFVDLKNVDKKENLVFHRTNIPYEKFFCGQLNIDMSQFGHDPKRCETRLKGIGKSAEFASGPELDHGLQTTHASETSTFDWITISIFGLLSVGILFLGFVGYIYFRKTTTGSKTQQRRKPFPKKLVNVSTKMSPKSDTKVTSKTKSPAGTSPTKDIRPTKKVIIKEINSSVSL